MVDTLLDELERLAPPVPTTPDWNDVLRRGRVHRVRRRTVGMAVAAAVLAIAVPAVALSGLLDLVRPVPVLHSAQPLVSARVGNGFYAHLWRSRSTTGGSCVFATYNHVAGTARLLPLFSGGGACSRKGELTASPTTAAHPLAVTLSVERRLGVASRQWVPPVVWGAVDPGLHAARVAVVWRGGRHDLTLRKDWFAGGGRGLFIPPLHKFPFFVVAYDRDGHEVARRKLDSPTLLMVNGWKEFTRRYKVWKRTHP